MISEKDNNKKNEQHPIDAYYECLSYCDINPKGIDEDCESICIERHLKGNLWWITKIKLTYINWSILSKYLSFLMKKKKKWKCKKKKYSAWKGGKCICHN